MSAVQPQCFGQHEGVDTDCPQGTWFGEVRQVAMVSWTGLTLARQEEGGLIDQETMQMPQVKCSWVNIFLHCCDFVIHNDTDLGPFG